MTKVDKAIDEITEILRPVTIPSMQTREAINKLQSLLKQAELEGYQRGLAENNDAS